MKRTKKLISMLAALALILGATWAVTLWNPENEEEGEEETVYTSVFTLDPETITALSWDYSEYMGFAKDGDEWVYEENPVFPLDESQISTMLEVLADIRSSKTIEAVEDWDQYTLEVPICEIHVTADGVEHTITIGEETAMGGEIYLSIGDGNVYLVDCEVLDAFTCQLYDLLAYESIPYMSGITGMDVQASTQAYEIRKLENSGLSYSDDYVWFLGEEALDNERTEDLFYIIQDLEWVECVDYDAQDLSQYGLAEPSAVVTLYYTETVETAAGETDEAASFTLEIGDAAGSSCYARLPGSHMVYTIDGNIRETLLYTTSYELMPDEVVLLDWEAVYALDVVLDDVTYAMTRDTRTVTDDEGNTTEAEVWLLEGEQVDAGTILDALDDMTSQGYASGLTPERGQEIRFVFYRENGNYPTVELAFYAYNSTACLTILNGEATVLAERSAVVDLVEAVNSLVLE